MSVLNAHLGEVEADDRLYASSKKVYPQSVKGTFRRLKWILLWICMGLYYFLPFVRWDRGPNEPHQAVLIALDHSRFYFFFIELWPQEVYYFTGLLIIASLALFLANALIGRAWCGFTCPQTVWIDLFTWVEKAIEGDRRERMKLDAAPWTRDKILKRVAKHTIWLGIAWWTGGAFVLYFADAPTLVQQLVTFQASIIVWASIATLTFTTYYLAGHMREQFCLYMCPWPRIQAALTDPDALNITYRNDRGEPRMSLKQATRSRAAGLPAGDCIDCNQCVAVCPTGVDIRHGLQPGCIQCGLCIDACDAVMTKVHRPIRLIAYDTDDNIRRRKIGERTIVRPIRGRTIAYAATIVFVGALMIYQLATRQHLSLTAMHLRAPMFTATHDGGVRNGYTLRLANKWSEAHKFAISVEGLNDVALKSDQASVSVDGRLVVEVDPDANQEIDLFVTAPRVSLDSSSSFISFHATDIVTGEVATAGDHFFGP